MWPFWFAVRRTKPHNGKVFLGLHDPTTVQNPHAHCANYEKPSCVIDMMCWVKAIVHGKVLLGNLGKHSMVGQNLEMSRETSTIYIHPHNVMVFMNVQGACPF